MSDTRKVIYAEPTGGLCNRMGALHYAYQFAKEFDCRLVVLWKDNFEAACRFEDVFEPLDTHVEIRNIRYFKRTPKELLQRGRIISFAVRAVWHGILSLYMGHYRKREIELVYESDGFSRKEAHRRNTERLGEFAASPQKWCCLCSYQCADLDHDYSALKFHPEYEERTREVYEVRLGKFESKTAYQEFVRANVVGVHIRRGDHSYAIQNNPLEGFAGKMENELIQNPQIYFFLASDGEDAIAYMRGRFGDRIIYNEGARLTRRSKTGMDNAIVELLALSKTGRIIGSFGSTFSDMASYIGKNELIYSNSNTVNV